MDWFWIFLCLIWKAQSDDRLIIISVDGMRSDHLEQYRTPFLFQIAESGVSCTNVYPVFPSETFPNHHTISTGLWAENHGIIMNKFDEITTGRVAGKKFTKDSTDEQFWNPTRNIVPIYIANQLAKPTHKSASFMWPGSSVFYSGKNISYVHKYEKGMNMEEKFTKVKDLYLSGKFNFMMFYLDDVDITQHRAGTMNRNTFPVIRAFDELFEKFFKDITAKYKDVHFVIVGDHGITEIDEEKLIKPQQIFDGINVEVVFDGFVVGLIPGRDSVPNTLNDPDEIVKKLNGIAADRWVAYKKEDLPDEYHYSKNPNIPPILVLPKNGFYIDRVADHGSYAKDVKDMRTIFVAHGPKFAKKKKLPEMSLTDIYPICCRVLGVDNKCHTADSTFSVANILHQA